MSTKEELYRAFLDIYCPVFTFVTIIMQSILLFFIRFYSGGTRFTIRYLLSHISICQLILLFITMTCQFRMISSKIPVEVRCYGPFRYIKPLYTYALHQAWQFFMFMSGMSIMITLYFKVKTLTTERFTFTGNLLIFLLFHIPVFFSGGLEVYLVITVALPDEVQESLALRNTDVSLYSTTGIMRLSNVSLLNFIIMVGAVFVYPVASYFFRRHILNRLEDHLKNQSENNKKSHRSFATGLTIQSVLPILTYLPTFSLYIYCVLSGTEILFQQYGIYLMPVIPAFIDPFLTLYFMVPFRNKIKRWMGIKKKTSVGPTSVSTTIM